eukprot:NODE_746_length_4249_cov_0.268916.p1 type:complete len:443 gc:universal NODE_746_length_4249_cov_0.268916:3281-1953(-)
MSLGDTSFMLLCSYLVFIMIPGLGYFYNGLTNSKAALSILLLCFMTCSIVSIQWFMFGYSLVFSKQGNSFIGSIEDAGYGSLTGQDNSYGSIPDFGFAFYQMMFACLTPSLIVGAGADKTRLLPKIVFVFIWTTLVYDFIAHWVWNGFLDDMGVLDFAGGSVVHIASGSAALAYTLMLGRNKMEKSEAHSPANVLMGTLFLWFGWNGFNGGSARSAGNQAANAIMATNIAAAAGSLSWMGLNYIKTKKFSAIAFCSGAISGLVSITPAAGLIDPRFAIIFGLIGGALCFGMSLLKIIWKLDDTLDVFTIHGIGGIVGNLLTGIFASREWSYGMIHPNKQSGLVDGEGIIGYQLLSCIICFLWSFCMTALILYCINHFPGLNLKLELADLEKGIDMAEMGETTFDFAKSLQKPKVQTRDFGTSTHKPTWGIIRRGSNMSDDSQ